ncbi:GTP 3',8-cyclase MoaA [Rhodocyclus purpureus]|uniref:GTP 3',8-cyclase MoaA n=1 Tax=Rhodocyclus purpureus TaxID=1067 RepID=UPI0019138628|nr:GTP 3',8-cyclase MoaA [Rhodocyclus purpureus]MBK5913651.1 GTP 3',8-cyclase MoaA [Rhodocyclus purpureus]
MSTNALVDRFGRRIDYLRLSVTDRCDLRCSYCMPQGFKDYEEPEDWLRFDEIVRLIALFARHGLQRVRLTGGEPLLRGRLVDLVRQIKAIPGISDLSLSTNGTHLARHAASLRAAGVDRLNVSLDTLNRERFCSITHRDALDDVLRGLRDARAAGFTRIKINMVWLAGGNNDELDAMIDFCRQQHFVLRLIETMPIGATGRASRYGSLQPHIAELRQRFHLVDGVVAGGGPARYLVDPESDFSIGFITPLSQHFCASCNRVRMTVDGTLQLCLGQEDQVAFRPLLRGGADDAELDAVLRAAIERKPERHEFNEAPGKVVRFMSMTGG